MKKSFAFLFTACLCMVSCLAWSSVQVKKASPVKKQETSGMESVTNGSLIPGVLNLVTNVSALAKQQKELAAECIPTSSELKWVNNLVKEYAKTGATMTVKKRCSGGNTYKKMVENDYKDDLCTDVYSDDENGDDKTAFLENYPKADTAEYCADTDFSVSDCPPSKKKTVSNIYDIFVQIDFDQEDLLTSESTNYVKMQEKAEKCAPEKVKARTKQAATNLLKETITGAGQKSNSAAVWDAVGGLTSSGGVLQGLQGLTPTITQFLGE